MVTQTPISRSSHSNPVSYTKAYEGIRKLLAEQPMSKQKGFKPRHFSLNITGGRCEECAGEGRRVVEMQFISNVDIVCQACEGKMFKKEVLDVSYKGKNIYEMLNLSVSEALIFFEDVPLVVSRLRPLEQVGLGYLKLGQKSNSLSGGEAQRVKLASFMNRTEKKSHILFIFDEPTTGLHFEDIHYLLKAFEALLQEGHSVVLIEHNIEVVKCADWIIDMGPESGQGGGYVCFEGVPERMLKLKRNHTARYLRQKMSSS